MGELAYVKLDDQGIAQRLAALEGWSVERGLLTKTYSFGAYKDGVIFAAAVGHVADKLNHHPDMKVGYGKVTIEVNTHDVGGLSPYDFELAKRIDQL